MKGLRGLFRLGTLTLLALMLTVALALPSSAASTCSSTQMLEEVEIVNVMEKAAPAVWSAQDLVNFDYDGDIENGLLEVKFKDIMDTRGLDNFDGYVIKATPGDDDPGDSDNLGVDAYESKTLVARPLVIGSTVTEILNLEPGTKYYVTVYAVNHNTVQISPDQRAQDSSSATTLLSAPFLGALDWGLTETRSAQTTYGDPCLSDTADGCDNSWRAGALTDDDYKGAHFSLYGAAGEAGQHYFHWLNPGDYGPFDHVLDKSDDDKDKDKQADMLSFNKDGEVENHCKNADINGDCGHTHYQFKAVDDNGNTVASELVETGGELTAAGADYFRTVFTAESGDLTLSVSLGRMVGGKYKAMSDTASVMFEAPDDLRALDQTYDEYLKVNSDIIASVDDTDDVDRYRDSTFAARSSTATVGKTFEDDDAVKAAETKDKMVAYLNNQLK